MAQNKSKTSRLSYIEETPKHYRKLEQVAMKGVSKGIATSKKAGLYITYARGRNIVREYPDGRIETIGRLENKPIKVEQGSKVTLP